MHWVSWANSYGSVSITSRFFHYLLVGVNLAKFPQIFIQIWFAKMNGENIVYLDCVTIGKFCALAWRAKVLFLAEQFDTFVTLFGCVDVILRVENKIESQIVFQRTKLQTNTNERGLLLTSSEEHCHLSHHVGHPNRINANLRVGSLTLQVSEIF